MPTTSKYSIPLKFKDILRYIKICVTYENKCTDIYSMEHKCRYTTLITKFNINHTNWF